jgi:hypothetical protein
MRSERREFGLNELEPVGGELGQESAFGGNALLRMIWSTLDSLSPEVRHLHLVKEWRSHNPSNQAHNTLLDLSRQRQLSYLHSP